MDLDEAIAILLELLRNDRARNYGYDLYARTGAEFAARQRHPHEHYLDGPVRELSPIFYEAAWELCRRGIVRPGVRRSGEQAVEEGGYSLTVAGRAALANLDAATILIAQPGSLAATFNGYRQLFGDGFHQRAMEAIRCRNAEAWLACCAMVGAAAESILLAIAITKEGDEERVLRVYRGNRGRQAVLNMIIGQADVQRRNTLTTFAGIVSLWRDDAAHGRASPIDTSNADEALRQLLHMCQWVDREWDNLTA
ncbi:hypothetical protein NLM27_38270 [Bradyrhizobium sp. CCGB12]|uniref:hypothetical protein n=1 Tax=Bradyrhizobium sp. CCGB12 TaxID=2949632 RepID=UPI0020B1E480|nr:hypothetical protein [Bradyrhizobium sp. CCGB12]MCP3394602.1 hypothetical protein [Bradyrhizobium sp. CCGB12]